MTNEDKVSMIKASLIGALFGGGITALTGLSGAKHDREHRDLIDNGTPDNTMVVPLSKRHFMKAVGLGKKDAGKGSMSADFLENMTPKEIEAMKRDLLRKGLRPKHASADCESSAECTQKLPIRLKEHLGPTATMSSIKKPPRNAKGQFTTMSDMDKKASFKGLIGKFADKFGLKDYGNNTLGMAGTLLSGVAGVAGGAYLTNLLINKISRNKKAKKLETSRKRYIDMLKSEVNDDDEPYSRSEKTAQQRDLLSPSGISGLSLALGGVSAVVAARIIYKAMENHRKEKEAREADELSNYPVNKNIEFKFAEENPRFFQKRASFIDEWAPFDDRLSEAYDDLKLNIRGGLQKPKLWWARNFWSGKDYADRFLDEYLMPSKGGKGGTGSSYYEAGKKLQDEKFNKEMLYQAQNTAGFNTRLMQRLAGDDKSARVLRSAIYNKAKGGRFYDPLARFAINNTDMGRAALLDSVLDKTLPNIGGDKDIAKMLLATGSNM